MALTVSAFKDELRLLEKEISPLEEETKWIPAIWFAHQLAATKPVGSRVHEYVDLRTTLYETAENIDEVLGMSPDTQDQRLLIRIFRVSRAKIHFLNCIDYISSWFDDDGDNDDEPPQPLKPSLSPLVALRHVSQVS